MNQQASHFEDNLGIAKPTCKTRVVVAMSGGVDSSVVAAKLCEAGYEVIGVTLQLYDHGTMLSRKGACCAGRDIHDARRIAEKFGFPHYVLDYESHFKKNVIDEFVNSYSSGYTPVPCIRCNERVKFSELLHTARELGADCMATGHYVRRVQGVHGVELHRASDPERDQSYFLYTVTPQQLEFLRFPLGGLQSKAETRRYAEMYGLEVADKPDSQDICFVPNGNYAALVEKLNPSAAEAGIIVDMKGNILGSHSGIINYTIGQRRRLGIGGLDEPLYVIKLDASTNMVTVGPRSALKSVSFHINSVNWLHQLPLCENAVWDVDVRVRSTGERVRAIIRPTSANEAMVESIEVIWGVTPGQACVFYECDSNRVLGGGWISQFSKPEFENLESLPIEGTV